MRPKVGLCPTIPVKEEGMRIAGDQSLVGDQRRILELGCQYIGNHQSGLRSAFAQFVFENVHRFGKDIVLGGRPLCSLTTVRAERAERRQNKIGGPYYWLARRRTELSRTLTPGTVYSSLISSASLWLIPSLQGVKIMTAGATLATW